MADESAFLRAVREDPDADGPRLVYADWLDEQGDPRGEFIRVQCRLAHLSPDDPETDALKRRETELREQHRAEWGALPRDLHLTDWKHHRGLIEEVTARVTAFVVQARRLFELFPVRQVRLEELAFARLPVLKVLAFEPALAQVRRLDLSNNRAPSWQVDPLLASHHLTGLTWLDLRGNPLDFDTLQLLATARHLPRLTTIHLRRDEVSGGNARSPYWNVLRTRYRGLV
jgi:uncharacterized protein (TIGR02996 family)